MKFDNVKLAGFCNNEIDRYGDLTELEITLVIPVEKNHVEMWKNRLIDLGESFKIEITERANHIESVENRGKTLLFDHVKGVKEAMETIKEKNKKPDIAKTPAQSSVLTAIAEELCDLILRVSDKEALENLTKALALIQSTRKLL